MAAQRPPLVFRYALTSFSSTQRFESASAAPTATETIARAPYSAPAPASRTPPATHTVVYAALRAGSRSIVLFMKLRPSLVLSSLFFFRLSVRSPQRSHQSANTGGDSEAETDDGQPASRSQF